MNVRAATKSYEDFLRRNLPVVEADLTRKHEQMRKALFPFLRSTFYRWSALFREVCPDLVAAPALLAVGDLHIENFGTWRDPEGRLIWGVNDVDEAQEMPYAIDLVRLATSAMFAADEAQLPLSSEDIAGAILLGYGAALQSGGRPFVLEEEHGWLRDLATGALRAPKPFWTKMQALPPAEPPPDVAGLLIKHLPKGAVTGRFASRVAGLGSLGRPRFVVLAELSGGAVTREAKAMLPSAWNWSLGEEKAPLRCGAIMKQAVRCADPCLDFVVNEASISGWAIRRLAPLCSRVELSDLPARKGDLRLLQAMGFETANLHLGSTPGIEAVRLDLAARKPDWLSHASMAMAEATRRDWQEWRSLPTLKI
jgi:hypothetical protein